MKTENMIVPEFEDKETIYNGMELLQFVNTEIDLENIHFVDVLFDWIIHDPTTIIGITGNERNERLYYVERSLIKLNDEKKKEISYIRLQNNKYDSLRLIDTIDNLISNNSKIIIIDRLDDVENYKYLFLFMNEKKDVKFIILSDYKIFFVLIKRRIPNCAIKMLDITQTIHTMNTKIYKEHYQNKDYIEYRYIYHITSIRMHLDGDIISSFLHYDNEENFEILDSLNEEKRLFHSVELVLEKICLEFLYTIIYDEIICKNFYSSKKFIESRLKEIFLYRYEYKDFYDILRKQFTESCDRDLTKQEEQYFISCLVDSGYLVEYDGYTIVNGKVHKKTEYAFSDPNCYFILIYNTFYKIMKTIESILNKDLYEIKKIYICKIMKKAIGNYILTQIVKSNSIKPSIVSYEGLFNNYIMTKNNSSIDLQVIQTSVKNDKIYKIEQYFGPINSIKEMPIIVKKDNNYIEFNF